MKLNIPKLSSALLEHNLNQSALAELVGVSREAVSQWMKGESIPRDNKLLKISKALGISFGDLLIDENAPIAEFRKKGNFLIDHAKEQKALAQATLLSKLSDYLPYSRITEFSTFVNPTLDYKYIQEAAGLIRSKLKFNEEGILNWTTIFELFRDSRVIFVPVLWGDKNYKNGLHIYLPDSSTHWIFINLDTPVLDFAFMVSHELGHSKAPGLSKEDAELFADAFAGALLCPWELCEVLYEKISLLSNDGQIVNFIKDTALKYKISAITIVKEINKYAEANNLAKLDLNIFPAASNMNKEFGTLSSYIFGDKEVNFENYLDVAKNLFHSCFFDCLQQFLVSEEFSNLNEKIRYTSSLLDIGINDAKDIVLGLTSGTEL